MYAVPNITVLQFHYGIIVVDLQCYSHRDMNQISVNGICGVVQFIIQKVVPFM